MKNTAIWLSLLVIVTLAAGCRSEEEQCARENDKAACTTVLEQAKQAESGGNAEAAAKGYRTACWGGLVDACLARGALREREQKPTAAVADYAKACDMENIEGCMRACKLVNPKKNPEVADRACGRAVSELMQTCVKGNAQSCESMRALIVVHGAALSGEKFWRHMCEQVGNGADCLSLADLLLERDDEMGALGPLRKGCDAKHIECCHKLGTMFAEHGDIKKAREPLGRSCEGGNLDDCQTVAELLYRQGDKKEAEGPAGKACEADKASACGVLGQILRERNEIAPATAAMRKACDGQIASACSVLGAMLQQAKDDAGAIDAYGKACQGDDAPGCGQLGYMLVQKGDRKGALEPLKKACEGNSAVGCYNLGLELKEARQLSEAQAAFAKACQAGEAIACKHVRK